LICSFQQGNLDFVLNVRAQSGVYLFAVENIGDYVDGIYTAALLPLDQGDSLVEVALENVK